MDGDQPQQGDATGSSSRPTLGFPLGTALLLIVIFGLSGMFSCCYHWEKLQSLRRRALRRPRRGGEDHEEITSGDPQDMPSPPSKPSPASQSLKQVERESLPVIMPGDRIPKFIAWPCPCDIRPCSAPLPPPPPEPEEIKITVEVEVQTPTPSPAAGPCSTSESPPSEASVN